MIFGKTKKVFSTDYFKHGRDKKDMKKVARGTEGMDIMAEKRWLRDEILDRKKGGVTFDEMADIVAKARYGEGDHINKKEARSIAKRFGIDDRRLMKARDRYLEEKEKKSGIARPYGQRDDDRLTLGKHGGSDDGNSSSSIPRHPMF